ncbi:type II toxin-antitoxin system ParD family antitoxin [Acuticoccus sediminis]|uniref:Type II toxin-antitoxin system ParD family antitoxin n=1 Tax=Acuticoccus sediminis TaxID=2184697 RepID=A0A8B2NJ61_9HYPH|nr:type II toxin-antitoxin system ParD family antitoxin [Acuticoccus sediminis]RAH95679.1 type II toxin-antitoxin system ParD family antitoxin [Acuticoccus sediminis]
MAKNLNACQARAPHQEAFVESLISSGRYHDVSDVVRAGLRLLKEKEARRQAAMGRIEGAVAEGLASEFDGIEAIIAKAEAENAAERDQVGLGCGENSWDELGGLLMEKTNGTRLSIDDIDEAIADAGVTHGSRGLTRR